MIITTSKNGDKKFQFLNIYPDQFLPEKDKLQDPDWIKETMDYFSNIAYSQYLENQHTFVPNYNLVKGILTPQDYYQEPEIKSFTEQIMGGDDLPAYVKHYSILNPPLNTLVGEASKRPDMYRVKAFDEDSQSEELQFKTQLYQQFVQQQISQQVQMQVSMQGGDPNSDETQQLTVEKMKDYMMDYTSMGERWANHKLEQSKVIFNLKELTEEALRDLVICSRQYYHIYENNSKVGFNIRTENPKNVWRMAVPDKKYTRDAYAAGTVQVMEISEIIEEIPELTKEEIDHLRAGLNAYGLLEGRPPAYEQGLVGNDSIQYDTYDPLVYKEMQILEAEMIAGETQGRDYLSELFSLNSSLGAFGHKYVVTRAYWQSKMLIKGVHYLDEEGVPQFMMTDETYQDGSHPGEVQVEEGWANVWYMGIRIGPEVYKVRPLKILDYCPIIGVVHEAKNTQARSLVDMLKPYQILYNVCMNQLFKLLEKEIGRVLLTSIRHVPIPKDGDAQDALEVWEAEARAKGVVFVDDSLENTKGPSSFNQSSAQDLTRTAEIQSRYQLAAQLKNEAWELVGITRQRLGGSSGATETATQTQTGLQQSYTQTEPIFVQHEYVKGQLYQAILDVSQYMDAQKPESTIAYVNDQGESAFLKILGSQLKGRDLLLFPTNRPEDVELFREIRSLSQAMLQNGASAYEVVELYSTNSVRMLKKIFKDLKDKQEQYAQNQQQMEQQGLEQKQQEFQAAQQAAAQEAELQRDWESHEKELDRLNKKEVALIGALSKNPAATADNDGDGLADALEVTRQTQEAQMADRNYQMELSKMAASNKEARDKTFLELERIKVEREKMKNDKEMTQLKTKADLQKARLQKAKPAAGKKK